MDVGRIYSLAAVLFVFGVLFFIEKHFAKERNKNGF
jgi:hypothetical protein